MKKHFTKIDRRTARSRTALKEALLTLMVQKPFAKISITEIVELANYNRGTFYFNYESKDDLLDELLGDLVRNLTQSFRAPYEKNEVFRINEIPAESIMIFEHIYRNASIYNALLKSDVLPILKDKMFIALK
ncbi:TetR/AcrR family transcriptional regulator [Paenibacillus sp. GCM10023250]|uniref:TetR/AcrR family transcriptional regulator n=1 Tax=Paenibacillus sp. GCM10023250 TaxID=3252648 RepID=UPI00360D82B3